MTAANVPTMFQPFQPVLLNEPHNFEDLVLTKSIISMGHLIGHVGTVGTGWNKNGSVGG